MTKHAIYCLVLLLVLTACTTTDTIPSPTPIRISKVLATVAISPTPNADERAATQAAITPTFLPPTPTVIPTETPYVGIFIGEAERASGFSSFVESLFADELVQAEPTANATRCNTPIDSPYLPTWQTTPIVNERLGCPIQGAFNFFGQVQVFENGVMYYYPELNALWAIATSPNVARFDYLENPTAQELGDIQAPLGLFVPSGVFGDMWAGVPNVRDRLGFAQTQPQEIALGLQRFANGTFLHDINGEQVFGLVTDGTLLGPYLAPSNVTAPVVPTATGILPPAATTPLPTSAGAFPEPQVTPQ